ncbi:MAG: hemerythrin domain-containing protein [Bacteroidetes bacterium]|nr:hemerythrin domain-containing protein [Bacteroidota bacterium]
MKRHESIVALSREHHFGLLFCWKIRQALKKQVAPERIQPYVKYFWDNHLKPHFKEEETWLFAALQDTLVDQAIAEHKHIEQLANELLAKEPVQTADLSTLATAVDDHIRFEERKLFPHLEKELSQDQLLVLGQKLQELHPTREKDDYPDEFWV